MNNIEPSNNYTDAETKGLQLLREYGFIAIQQLDWIGKNSDGEWIIVEVKDKELFTPGINYPHLGTGLDKSQAYLRAKLLEEKGIKTYLLTFDKKTDEVYGAYLDNLEFMGKFHDTKKDIRIYPIENFSKGVEAVGRDLNGY